MTQEELASLANTSKSTIRRAESNVAIWDETAKDICSILQINIDEVIGVIHSDINAEAILVGVPPELKMFVGRELEISKIHDILLRNRGNEIIAQADKDLGRVAIWGVGGGGKSTLASEYVHRRKNDYSGICWCPADTRIGILTALANLAIQLNASIRRGADLEMTARKAISLTAKADPPYLFVYDNVENPDDIKDLLPNIGTRVLITSRFSDWNVWAEGVELGVLSLSEAISFLKVRSERLSDDGAETLAKELGCLPLALDHAAAFCKRTESSFEDCTRLVTSLIEEVPKGVAYPRAIGATFRLAIDAAISLSPDAGKMMAVLCRCEPDKIPSTLTHAAFSDPFKAAAALGALAVHSLIRPDRIDNDELGWSMHRLVRLVARHRWTDDQEASRDLTECLCKIYPTEGYRDPSTWKECKALSPHLLEHCALQEAGGVQTKEMGDLLTRAGEYYHGCGAYQQAHAVLTKAYKTRKEAHGVSNRDRLTSLNNLAHILQVMGKLDHARELHEQTLCERKRELGSRDEHTAVSYNNLGLLKKDQGDFSEAKILLLRALVIRIIEYGPDNSLVVQIYNNLAHLFQMQGIHDKALDLFDYALSWHIYKLGDLHPSTINIINNIGFFLYEMNRYEEARFYLSWAVRAAEAELGTQNPLTARYQINLSRLMLATGDVSDALELGTRGLTTHLETLTDDHPWTIASKKLVKDASRSQL